jgi:type IV pilus assembly protein PilY1
MTMNRLPILPLALCAVTFLAGVSAPQQVQAAQGEGNLAQAPLNLGTQVPPAFIMAVDDSGSMTFETLFPGRDGYGCTGTNTTHPFFNNTGTIRTASGTNGVCNFHHLIPYVGHRIGTNRYAIPPIDQFGFARSPEYNPSYFDPSTEYLPWIDQNGVELPQASITATRARPRLATPTMNMTVLHRDRNDDEAENTTFVGTGAATYNAGTIFPAGIHYARNGGCGGLASTGGVGVFVELASDHVLTADCNNIALRRYNRDRPENDERFRIPQGTVLPAGTRYYRDNACGGLGATLTLQRVWITLQTDTTVTANCDDTGIEYFPATFFLPIGAPAPDGFITANRTVAVNAGGTGVNLYRYEIRPANYSTAAEYDAAIQNFANWFSFYGNRNRAMIAGMTRSLVDVTNMRIGYFRINQYTGSPVSAGVYPQLTMRNMAAPAQKTALYNELLALTASGSTPNRWAVRHIGEQFKRVDAGAPVQLACQKNAGMLFTDGYSNQDGPAATPNNADGGMGPPFADTFNNTMADLAAQYYLTNPRPDLQEGRVPIPQTCPSSDLRVDCNANLHVNFYGITLGATGFVYGVNAAATADPFANPPAWQTRQNDNPSTVDEIWHATLNARGKFINAQSPAAITTAMREILQAVSEGAGPSGTIALSGARVGDSSLTVVPQYASRNNGTDWYGELRADEPVVTNGVVSYTTIWNASEQLPAAGARNIQFARPATTVNPTVSAFTTANVGALSALCNGPLSRCSAAEITGLGVTANQAIDFLRGNSALEGSFLRERTTKLGDFVNSSPVISSPKDNYGYRSLYGASALDIDPYNYLGYMATKAARPSIVYAGANDGMLHAFSAETGQEVFGYIPSMVLGHMGNLLFPYNAADGNDQKFQHRYFVDGPITVSDARLGASWRTVLVGSAGAGGKGVFALDVSNPGAFGPSNVLWEVSGSVAGTTGQRIGHVLGKPVVVPTRVGTNAPVWKAVFGNGFGSTSGNASLFVVDVENGNVTTIEAVEAGGPGTPNGLGSVVLVDRYVSNTATRGSDGYADTAYGGDLHGNVWKFDLRNNTVANGGIPIFTASIAGQRQPITGGLEVASGPGGGVLIYFGTGSYSFENDATDQSLQSLYTVLDTGSTTPNTATRANLASQQLVSAMDGFRTLSGNAVDYVTQRGWYMDLATVLGGDLTLLGERFVGNPRLQSGLILFPTFEPGGIAGDPCAAGGTNWLYALNAISGASGLSGLRAGSPTGPAAPSGTVGTQLQTSGTIPVKDVAVLLPPPPGAVESTATAAEIAAALARTCDLVISVAGAPPLYLPRACGRQSWRQVR